jgi:uncharacterized protein
MLIILSPSKTIDESSQSSVTTHTIPVNLTKSDQLVKIIRKMELAELSEKMEISSKLAQQTYDRFQFWNKHHELSSSKQAVLSFKGDVYTGLNSSSLSESDLLYSQNHLIILSGLYGILRPLDLIQPYRLEIATKIQTKTHSDLYKFWKSKITSGIIKVLLETSNNLIINLASNEYYKSIDEKKLKVNIITPVFKDFKNGEYKIISVYAKKMRGIMTNYIIKNRIIDPEELKLFNSDDYYYNFDLSTKKNMVFTRG